jgi:hypothetical protein
LGSAEYGQIPQSWNARTNEIAFAEGIHPGSGVDQLAFSMHERRTTSLIVNTGMDRHASFSPDGRWIVYAGGPADHERLYIEAYPRRGEPIEVSADGGYGPLWSPDGRTVYYRRPNGMYAAAFRPEAAAAGPPRKLFDGVFAAGDIWNRHVLLAPDGKRFLMMKEAHDEAEMRQVHVIVNWFEDVKRIASAARR